MRRIKAEAPYYTTFRRRVRTYRLEVSREVPFSLVEESIRRELTIEARHSIIESTWRDQSGYATVTEIQQGRDPRYVSVRYVTGGQRHGLPASLDWPTAPNMVEFVRAHGF
jgi:hypothetical protein